MPQKKSEYAERNRVRPSIYLTAPLMKVQEELEDETLSSRLARIAERYELICRHTKLLDKDQQVVLARALKDVEVTPLVIKYLDKELASLTDNRKALALAERIEAMTIAERVACIEQIGR